MKHSSDTRHQSLCSRPMKAGYISDCNLVQKENAESAKAFDPSLPPWKALDGHTRNFRVRGEMMLDGLVAAWEVGEEKEGEGAERGEGKEGEDQGGEERRR